MAMTEAPIQVAWAGLSIQSLAQDVEHEVHLALSDKVIHGVGIEPAQRSHPIGRHDVPESACRMLARHFLKHRHDFSHSLGSHARATHFFGPLGQRFGIAQDALRKSLRADDARLFKGKACVWRPCRIQLRGQRDHAAVVVSGTLLFTTQSGNRQISHAFNPCSHAKIVHK
jgi:hypothetical protein